MNMFSIGSFQEVAYIFSAILFIYGLKMLSKEDSAPAGNLVSSIGMLLAVIVSLIEVVNPILVLSAMLIGGLIGSLFAIRVKMTSIPEMVALFNGFGGLSSYLLAWSELQNLNSVNVITLIGALTIFIGGLTFSGSLIAFFKLSEYLKSTPSFLNSLSKYLLVICLVYLGLFSSYILLQSFGISLSFQPNFELSFFIFLVVSVFAGLVFVLPIGGGAVSYTHLTLPTT